MSNTPTQAKIALGEPDAHVISRHLQVVIRGLLVVATVATILLFLFYRPATYLAAIPIPLLVIVSAIVNDLERRSRASVLRRQRQNKITKEELEADVQAVGIATVLKVAGALALDLLMKALQAVRAPDLQPMSCRRCEAHQALLNRFFQVLR